MPDHLLTRWGRALDPERVLPEYPRPQWVRDSYLNLNGRWEIAFRPLGDREPREYDGQVLVPFSPEAPLSGVGRQLQPDEHLWYRRRIDLPAGCHDGTGRVLLHFGAVGQSCVVRLNGVEVGRNEGGYLPFACDVTDALRDGGSDLVVRVRDVGNNRVPSSGKQRLHHGGIWYTAQSGIWRTVWMERVPATRVERLDLVPRLDEGAVEVTVHAGVSGSTAGTAHVRVFAGGREVGSAEVTPGRPTTIPLTAVHPWTQEDPFLHDVEVTLGEDRVTSYLGLRSAPSDGAMVHDIATMKRLGFTVLRKHVKVEPLRWYHHCDRLGMLVWQDLPNGGGRYRSAAVTWRCRRRRTRGVPRGAAVHGRPAAQRPVADRVGAVQRGLGQFDAAAVALELAALDPTRLVDHASGWHDQGAGDLWSRHLYARRFRAPRRRRRDRRALALSEYGGYDLARGGPHEQRPRLRPPPLRVRRGSGRGVHAAARRPGPRGDSWSGRDRLHPVSDVEDEVNGLLTFDREVLKLPEETVRAALAPLREALSSRGRRDGG